MASTVAVLERVGCTDRGNASFIALLGGRDGAAALPAPDPVLEVCSEVGAEEPVPTPRPLSPTVIKTPAPPPVVLVVLR